LKLFQLISKGDNNTNRPYRIQGAWEEECIFLYLRLLQFRNGAKNLHRQRILLCVR